MDGSCPSPKEKEGTETQGFHTKKEDTPSSSLPSATRPKPNLAYYGITLRPTKGEVLDDLPPILTNSDESSDDDFAKEVNQTFLNHTTMLVNATSGADQVLFMTELAEAQPAPDENPVSPKVTPTNTTMEE